ncbi:MAG: hypothetical protein QM747_13105 [Nocardioides sp.]
MNRSDDELLQSVADLYGRLDPAPLDLADGVLARLAVQDLETEFELFTLVQPVDVHAGTRQEDEPETSRAVALEFAGSVYRVLVRISDADDGGRRVDGWVVPALPMRVFLGPPGDTLAHTRQSAYADREGRFEFPDAMSGEVRLWLLPQGTGEEPTAPPFVTPPFLV